MTVIERKDFAAMIGMAYSESIDLELLESKNEEVIKLFGQFSDCLEFIFFNYFGVEIEDVESDKNN
jgi:hypothetical protein